ncbi:hypothetical protein N9L68_04165 [bacterium]|nr:hypothetical protein [bacterium]
MGQGPHRNNHEEAWEDLCAAEQRLCEQGVFIAPLKVTSHQLEMGRRHSEDIFHVFVNAAADAAAEAGALDAALSLGEVHDQQEQDRRTELVLRRLVAIEKAMLQYGHQVGAPKEARRRKRPEPLVLWKQKLAAASHALVWTGQSFVCSVCRQARGPANLGRWLNQGRCPGAALGPRRTRIATGLEQRPWNQRSKWIADNVPALLEELHEEIEEGTVRTDLTPPVIEESELHASHRLSSRGVWTWCRTCGNCTREGSEPQKLLTQCAELKISGRQVLPLVARGFPPGGKQELWGDGTDTQATVRPTYSTAFQ